MLYTYIFFSPSPMILMNKNCKYANSMFWAKINYSRILNGNTIEHENNMFKNIIRQ